MDMTVDGYVLYFFIFCLYGTRENAGYVSKKWLYFSSPAFNVKRFYKVWFFHIFVKRGRGLGIKTLENQMKLYWSWGQIICFLPGLSLFISCISKDRISFEGERKK